MNNLYKEMVRKPGDLCFEVSLESDKGLTMTDLSFALKFFVYGHPKNVCIHKDDLKVVEGKYYAVLNEHGFVNGVLFCEAEIVETINGINRIVSVRSNAGYMIGNCCQPSVDTSSCAHGYSLSLYKVEYVPQPIDPNPEEDQLIAEELFGERLSLPELTADRAIADEHGNRIADTYETRQAVRNHIRAVYNEQFNENPPLIMDGYITPQMLSEVVKDMLSQAGATINNVPDGEDLTTKNGVLKLSDKPYNPGAYSGLGRVYLRKNLVGGQNLLTQAMVSKPNTIYILQYDYDLNGAEITIPENCVLDFQGGSLSNGKNISCNKTLLQGNIKLDSSISLSGSIQNKEIEINWFGAKGDRITDDIEPIQKAIDSCSNLSNITTITGRDGIYRITKPINLCSYSSVLRHNISIVGRCRPNRNTAKGLIIEGDTGGAIIECIDNVMSNFENIELASGGTNPSTIGIVIARGEHFKYVPHIYMRNCNITINPYSLSSKDSNDGFGTIGILIQDGEESHFDNVDISANCCVAILNKLSSLYKVKLIDDYTFDKSVPFVYTPVYAKASSSYVSNTVYKFTNCRMLAYNGESPAFIGLGLMTLVVDNCFVQRPMTEGAAGTVNCAFQLNETRNININAVAEGFGKFILLEGSLDNSNINIAGDGKDNMSLMTVREPTGGERYNNNNNINLRCNSANAKLFNVLRRTAKDTSSNTYITPFHRFTNTIIKTNLNFDSHIANELDVFVNNNTLEFNDIAYANLGYNGYNIINKPVKLGALSAGKYYELIKLQLGNYYTSWSGADVNLKGTVMLYMGGHTDSQVDGSYVFDINIRISNIGAGKHDIKCAYDVDRKGHYGRYWEYFIRSIETIVVYNNVEGYVSLLCKPCRINNPGTTITSPIYAIAKLEANTGFIRSGLAVSIGNKPIDSIESYNTIQEGRLNRGDGSNTNLTFDPNMKDCRYFNTSKESIQIWDGSVWRNEDGTLVNNVTII